jgi:hypothetical protein
MNEKPIGRKLKPEDKRNIQKSSERATRTNLSTDNFGQFTVVPEQL